MARFATSSIGSKVVMAVTGLVLWAFIIAHLAGNLAMWAGRDAMNHYAALLHSVPEVLWVVRIGIIVAIPLHFWAAAMSTRANVAARPVAYVYPVKTPARLASKTMMLSGLVVLAFLAYHLAHFTWHLTNPGDVQQLSDGSIDVYTMVVRGFSVWWISAIYIVAQLLLAQHLSHGIYSLFQHLGIWGKEWTPFIKSAGIAVGYGISAAFISIPIAVLAGLMRLP